MPKIFLTSFWFPVLSQIMGTRASRAGVDIFVWADLKIILYIV